MTGSDSVRMFSPHSSSEAVWKALTIREWSDRASILSRTSAYGSALFVMTVLADEDVVEELEEDESSAPSVRLAPSVEDEDSVSAMDGGMETVPLALLISLVVPLIVVS